MRFSVREQHLQFDCPEWARNLVLELTRLEESSQTWMAFSLQYLPNCITTTPKKSDNRNTKERFSDFKDEEKNVLHFMPDKDWNGIRKSKAGHPQKDQEEVETLQNT